MGKRSVLHLSVELNANQSFRSLSQHASLPCQSDFHSQHGIGEKYIKIRKFGEKPDDASTRSKLRHLFIIFGSLFNFDKLLSSCITVEL